MELLKYFERSEIKSTIVNYKGDNYMSEYNSKLGYITVYKVYLENEFIKIYYRKVSFDKDLNREFPVNLFYDKEQSYRGFNMSIFKSITVENKMNGDIVKCGKNSNKASELIKEIFKKYSDNNLRV